MRRLAVASALSLSLLTPAARAEDTPADRRERALELRERAQDQRERTFDVRELRDDQRDLARIESLAARLETMRPVRPPGWAVAALDADVQRELTSERLEGRAELRRDSQQVRRGQAEDRRDLAGDVRVQQVEAAQGQRLEQLRREWTTLRGRYGRPGMERRRVLMGEFVALARQELAGDRQERREDRQGRRDDRQEHRDDRR